MYRRPMQTVGPKPLPQQIAGRGWDLVPIYAKHVVAGLSAGTQQLMPSPLYATEFYSDREGRMPANLVQWYQKELNHRDHIQRVLASQKPPDIPGDLARDICERPLKPYQVAGIRFLLTVGSGLLADATGLGKTVQALLAARLSKARTLIIIVPKFLSTKWCNEAAMWWPELLIFNAIPKPALRAALIQSYSDCDYAPTAKALLLNWDALHTQLPLLKKLRFDVLIGDEAQAIKNRDSLRSKATSEIRHDRAYLLSATPQDKAPNELWGLLRVIDPAVYTSYWRYTAQFMLQDWFGGWKKVSQEQLPYLRDLLYTRVLRREASEAGLPEPFEVPTPCDMHPAQRKLYNEASRQIVVELQSGNQLIMTSLLAKLTRLRQISVSPFCLGEEDNSGKLDAFVDLCRTYDNDQIVAVCSFKAGVRAAVARLHKVKITAGMLTGDTEDVGATVAAFRSGETRVLVMTPGVGGFGHDLEVANHCVFIDRPWSALMTQQVIGRTVRLGQTQNVAIHSLINHDSLDEDLEKLYKHKREVFDDIFVARTVAQSLLKGPQKTGSNMSAVQDAMSIFNA